MQKILTLSKPQMVELLWESDATFKSIFMEAKSIENNLKCDKNYDKESFYSKLIEEIRNKLFEYLNQVERSLYYIFSDSPIQHLHIYEKHTAKECIRVLKNIIRTENETLTRASVVVTLFELIKNKENFLDQIGEGFLCEMIFLLKGINGSSNIYNSNIDILNQRELNANDTENIRIRGKKLDFYSQMMERYFKNYHNGLENDIVQQRKKMKEKILRFFGGNDSDWEDYIWQMTHVIKDINTLSNLVQLSPDEMEGLKAAQQYGNPFQITPYYLSLFSESGRNELDRAVRAQVLPTRRYCENVHRSRTKDWDMDFMGEKSTSPIEGITRRYPEIVILKPFDSCPQICVYCQRNWELKPFENGGMDEKNLKQALKWIKNNKAIQEVLITGGDPLSLDNDYLEWLIGAISEIQHIKRIRLGTRTIITLPQRINDGFLAVLKKYHEWGKREICIVSHFEHATEMTPESLEAIKKIKNIGLNIYNQQVFTYYNSRKFETAYLRKTLKYCGIDPYYLFNTKGKIETMDFRVPIARIEQERKEEARLLSGMERTDEPVFNVPKLGKSHLRSWQEHEPIMILADGSRIYRFYPWESKLSLSDDYLYKDVPIYTYLQRLMLDKEPDIDDYRSIWYYF